MNPRFEVKETFEITGRGLVVALPVLAADLPHAQPLSIKILVPGQSPIHAKAFHEILLRYSPVALETSSLLLIGLRKEQVPLGAVLEIEVSEA
jgi:hypothetical protein